MQLLDLGCNRLATVHDVKAAIGLPSLQRLVLISNPVAARSSAFTNAFCNVWFSLLCVIHLCTCNAGIHMPVLRQTYQCITLFSLLHMLQCTTTNVHSDQKCTCNTEVYTRYANAHACSQAQRPSVDYNPPCSATRHKCRNTRNITQQEPCVLWGRLFVDH